MSKKTHNPGPVPAGNRQHSGTAFEVPDQDESGGTAGSPHPTGPGQDEKKRQQGDFTGTGQHSRHQPGPRNDGGGRHGEDAG
ncbi:MAG TPA: hypothetical protein VHR66_16855 [Gemmataceae bacterium]|jgi:hypothetical protein|nr:hypothetical protein [Gemmataceae bacterium]